MNRSVVTVLFHDWNPAPCHEHPPRQRRSIDYTGQLGRRSLLFLAATIISVDIIQNPAESDHDRLEAAECAHCRCRSAEVPVRLANDITIAELLERFWAWADGYYIKAGKPTGEISNLNYALKPLRELYGQTLAVEFGPLALEAIQRHFIVADVSRKVINQRIHKIRRVFRWGLRKELIPPSVVQSLAAVDCLKKGRTEARETQPIGPVADSRIDATLPHLPPQAVVDEAVRLRAD